MDVKREGVAKKKLIRRIIYGLIIATAVPAITWWLSKLKPAAPSVARETVWIDTVKRGPMLRQVRGLGTLVPEDIVWIPTQFEGRVDKIMLRSGEKVKPDTVLLVLGNPDMELAANDLEWQLKQAEANFTDLKVKLESQTLDQKSNLARTESDLTPLTEERWRELEQGLGIRRLDIQERPIAESLAGPRGGRELWAAALGMVLLLATIELFIARAVARQSA